jgi:hypothetical protein
LVCSFIAFWRYNEPEANSTFFPTVFGDRLPEVTIGRKGCVWEVIVVNRTYFSGASCA